MLNITKLNFRYPKSNSFCIDNINLILDKDEILGLVGPNGAGKTTLLKILSGLIIPHSGSIIFESIDLIRSKPSPRILGLCIGDDRSFYYRLTGAQNIEFFCGLAGLRKKEILIKLYELVEKLEMTKIIDKFYMTYSFGEKKKLSLIRGIILNPQLLLLDEPVNGLDFMSIRVVRNIIKEYKKGGRSILITSHNINEIEKICDKIAFIKNGKIIKCDSIDKIINETSNNVSELIVGIPQSTKNISSVLENLSKDNFVDTFTYDSRNLIIKTYYDYIPPSLINLLIENGLSITAFQKIKSTLEDAVFMLSENQKDEINV